METDQKSVPITFFFFPPALMLYFSMPGFRICSALLQEISLGKKLKSRIVVPAMGSNEQ